jgi:hypothetical protein
MKDEKEIKYKICREAKKCNVFGRDANVICGYIDGKVHRYNHHSSCDGVKDATMEEKFFAKVSGEI